MDPKTLIKSLSRWLRLTQKATVESLGAPPAPTELFHADQMEQRSVTLALSHELTKKQTPDILLKRLSECESILAQSCEALAHQTLDSFSPGREWLLDNAYLIQEQILAIRRYLPKKYGRKLPQLVGATPGYPRVYDISREIIKHADGRADLENLRRFIGAYQSVRKLSLAELWAIPITLGIALIENLSEASQRIVANRNDRVLAKNWVNRMVEVAISEPKQLVIIIADMARSKPSMSGAFVTEFSRRLQGTTLSLPLSWIEQHLQDFGSTLEQMVEEENKQQAANQVAVSNCITSLRHLGEIDWRIFVETMSVVEQTLRMDPTDTYGKMDFGTRDRYRHVVEHLSSQCKCPEESVASCVIELAQTHVPSCHVGFYLIGKGLPQLEKRLGIRRSFTRKLRESANKHALFCYAGSVGLITAGFTSVLLVKANSEGIGIGWLFALGATLAASASQLAIAIVNLVSALLIKPHALPRMDFSKGIPASYRSLVVVPVMLENQAKVESLVEALEVHFLGNRDTYLHFMLLSDFNDSSQEHKPEDIVLLVLAEKLIRDLNTRYPRDEGEIFFLCHRPRQWNPTENAWMGKERKRGKLEDLNNLLRGNVKTPFSLIVGNTDLLSDVKYVITLDSDTKLPRETARQLVGAVAHPLNKPRLDPARQVVIEGYGILQPRMARALPSAGANRYVRLCGNEFGLDPYTRTVSDIYQDIFEEGSFVGKGIYDVDMFQNVLEGRFPDNRILSHDLLEGCYLRSGYLSDVALYEESPSSYLADTRRRTRWIRGDWQLLTWLVANPLSPLSRFKIFDNLRRSLVPIALMLFFGLTWFVMTASAFWLGIVAGIVLLPAVARTVLELLKKPKDMLARQHLAHVIQIGNLCGAQVVAYLACLPHEAWYSLCAIVRTCFRLIVSKKHLLEWVPSDQTDQDLNNTLARWIGSLWMGPAAALAAVVVLMSQGRSKSILFATPLLALWFMSPLMARWLSQPHRRSEPELTLEQKRFLHRLARKTWGFFDRFMTIENHWLAPDNYQEEPVEVLARRTSPTNIGLSLLANLTALDFGYVSMEQFLSRTSNTLQSMSKLERYRGHFFNWYSTETLQPLSPRYISTVDSGNLTGHLLTLRQGLLALPDIPLLNPSYLDGLEDTWEILTMEFTKPLPTPLTRFDQILFEGRSSFNTWANALHSCEALCSAAEQINTLVPTASRSDDAAQWSNKLLLQSYALRDEIKSFATIPEMTPKTTLRDAAQSSSSDTAKSRMLLIETLIQQIFSFAQVDDSFLCKESSHFMAIGFNVDEQRLDSSNYDLLASEARLGIFVAIAQGQLLQESWFALGRSLVSSEGEPTLVSWSGSMFEYLMPLLVMPTYSGTLLDQTYHAAVRRQIDYGRQRDVPWGISESGLNALDTQFNYLYRAFGVPGLGLKRGLEEDLVTAPYASAMALMVAPQAACLNLQRLAQEGAVGKFGFYEAIDFTPSRLMRESKRALVHSFMSHHQGMCFLAFSYLLHRQPMQKRFMADPEIQATLLLLQERIPKPTAIYLQIPKSPQVADRQERPEPLRVFHTPTSRTPHVKLLSNGHYHVVLTQAGGGYSRWKDIALTRWREDSTRDHWGLFAYVRDVATGEFWSAIYQPTLGPIKGFKAIFTDAHAAFTHKTRLLDTHTEVAVSQEDDIELRRVRVHNHSNDHRVIEFTSYGEIVLAPQSTDLAQPAFSNLFIETKLSPDNQAIFATRRARDVGGSSPWLCHLLNVYGGQPSSISYETDRARFVGRGRSLVSPLAMLKPGPLSNSEGAVLDPIVAIRCRITIEPHSFVTFDLLTGVAETHSQCLALAQKYKDHRLANRIFGLAKAHAQVLLHHLNISEADAQLYGRLAGAIVYATNAHRPASSIIASNQQGQSSLWRYSISGDLPIVLLRIGDAENIELVRQLIQAKAYWGRKGLIVDLLILNEERISYRQSLQDQIMSLIPEGVQPEQAGHILVHAVEQVPAEDLVLFQSVARVVLSDKGGTLREQLNKVHVEPKPPALLSVDKTKRSQRTQKLPPVPKDLLFFNGLGGFSPSGDEYVIRLAGNNPTPAPWVNVLANPNFGSVVSESGQGYTWTENAHEFRLTPWDNDPVLDSGGEAFYLRDEETGRVWSPTPLPCPGDGDYQTRHGFGYSVFEHIEDGIHSELWIYVAPDASVKFFALKIRNDSKESRRLSAAGYVNWVLGDSSAKNALHVVTELSKDGAILAQNHFNSEFGERTAFFNAGTTPLDLIARTATGDRTEFLGRNGTPGQPAALKREHLSGQVGAGLDPCAAILLTFNLAVGQSRNIVFTLGAGQNKSDALAFAQRFTTISIADSVLVSVREHWKRMLGVIRVATPDPAIDLLANGWLLYQLLSSRLWGRSGYYQSSGAFGFRDQLQDVMALAHVAPSLFRNQILLCAAHQYEEGDVQHWWHPPSSRGVRTRCSDDYLWLPFAICHYVETTGDIKILDEAIPFLIGRPLKAEEESYYDLPTIGNNALSLYQHAVRAIEQGLKFGEHGLPLIGSGDWNDGMNLVGKAGRGESVWLGFFLYSVLKRFAPLALKYGDPEFAKLCDAHSTKLQQHIEASAWDGEWYRRAYFDDGTPLGSAQNSECRIDSLPQSWSVLSGAGDPARAKKAMASLKHLLVSESDGLVKLLDPPFNKSTPNPGYIEGYLPGIRENGGQYTHAAVWAAMAFAELGEDQTAWKLFNILNPINHSRDHEEMNRYKIEPYVVAADIYSVAPHVGRGGWSWYTGSAGWLYRLITETFLGLRLEEGKRLTFSPILPKAWEGFTLDYYHGATLYKITVKSGFGKHAVLLDDVLLGDGVIQLVDDGQIHHVINNLP
jgi:cyclic beta-1,2-glucan synthetase